MSLPQFLKVKKMDVCRKRIYRTRMTLIGRMFADKTLKISENQRHPRYPRSIQKYLNVEKMKNVLDIWMLEWQNKIGLIRNLECNDSIITKIIETEFFGKTRFFSRKIFCGKV